MDTYSEIINEFNSTFSTNTSLCEDLKIGWDLGNCRSFALYQLVEDQRSAPFGTFYTTISAATTLVRYTRQRGQLASGSVHDLIVLKNFSLCLQTRRLVD